MDLSSALQWLIPALSALVAAYLGHTAGSKALGADVKRVLADVQAGHSLPQLKADVADLKAVLDDIREVLKDAAATPAPKADA
jgi:hypothetical protein